MVSLDTRWCFRFRSPINLLFREVLGSLLELCYAKHCAKSINQIVITESWDDRGGFSVAVVSKDPGVLLRKFAHPPGSPPHQ